MDCVLTLLYKKLDVYTVDIDPDPKVKRGPCPKPSWGEAMKLLNNIGFLQILMNYPLDTINSEHLELLEPVTRMEDYTFEKYFSSP